MSNTSIKSILQSRIQTAQQTSELELGDTVYQSLFAAPTTSIGHSCDIPISKLRSFFTADIGFKPYPPAKLKALAEHMATDGQLERIIVRPISGSDEYEILAGHNRTAAGKLNGWATMAAEVIEADDNRATSIAVSTNLLRRQDLSIFERGKAYRALLDAQRRQGLRTDLQTSGEFRQKFNQASNDETFGESRQRYSARAIVAEFFGVSEYEIRKAIKLTQLIPELQEIIEEYPKLLNLTCAEKIADYDAITQNCFYEMCTVDGYQLTSSAVQYIVQKCPPPTADRQVVFAAWRETRAEEERRRMMPSKEIRFNRKRFAPYLDKLGSDAELEELFLEFLQERLK